MCVSQWGLLFNWNIGILWILNLQGFLWAGRCVFVCYLISTIVSDMIEIFCLSSLFDWNIDRTLIPSKHTACIYGAYVEIEKSGLFFKKLVQMWNSGLYFSKIRSIKVYFSSDFWSIFGLYYRLLPGLLSFGNTVIGQFPGAWHSVNDHYDSPILGNHEYSKK